MLTALQRHLIYFPSTADKDQLLTQATRLGLQPWQDQADQTIGWKSPAPAVPANRMLIFHGNAGYALDRYYFVQGFLALDTPWEVYLFEYPGYGSREGAPSEENFKAAASQAVKLLLEESPQPIFITGESLGSGVASYLASQFPDQVAGFFLVTPFARLADVASHHYPILPISLLLSERYDSAEALTHYDGPVAFLLAGQDEVVTTEQGQELYDSYNGPKWLNIVPNAGHNTLPYSPVTSWWQEVSDFLTRSKPYSEPPVR